MISGSIRAIVGPASRFEWRGKFVSEEAAHAASVAGMGAWPAQLQRNQSQDLHTVCSQGSDQEENFINV